MLTSALIRVFWPLLLLPLAVLAMWGWPGQGSGLAALLVLTAAWCTSAFLAHQRQLQLAGENAALQQGSMRLREGYQQLMERTEREVGAQFGHLDKELTQVRSLQRDATAGLVDSFTGLEAQARQQEDMVFQLIQRIAAQTQDGSGVSKFTQEAGDLVQLFVDSIVAMRDGSIELVDTLNAMSDQVSAIEKLLSEIDGISSQARAAA